MEVVGVRVEMPSNSPIVLLKEAQGDRYLPIWIGAVEATAIAFAQQGMVSLRPLTHDLFRDVLEVLNVQLRTVNITALRAARDVAGHIARLHATLVEDGLADAGLASGPPAAGTPHNAPREPAGLRSASGR